MKISRDLRKEINAAVRKHTQGATPLAEVGTRADVTGITTANALRWSDDSDLFDLYRLSTVKTIDDDIDNPGCYELDLYVTTGTGSDRELETNVAVLIRDGRVVGATAHSLRVHALKASLNFPIGKGW